jgi:hypothetical protein
LKAAQENARALEETLNETQANLEELAQQRLSLLHTNQQQAA